MPHRIKQLQDNQMRLIYDLAPVGLCIVTLEGDNPEVLYANALFEKTISTDLPAEVEAALRKKKDVPALDVPLRQNGWMRLTISPTQLEGKPAALIWATDISEIKRAANEAGYSSHGPRL